MDFTDHYGLIKVGPGENWSLNSYQFSEADRDLIDRILYQGATSHRHNGLETSVTAPTDVLTGVLDQDAGHLAPATDYYWVYTLSDVDGNESAPSPAMTLSTDARVSTPAIPNASQTSTGGALTEGTYFYAITAYQGSSEFETLTAGIKTVSIPVGTITNKVTLSLGALPAGADGFNIYRRNTGGSGVFFIGSTTSTSFEDAGLPPNCDRTVPTQNSTGSINEALLSFPGATPTVPVGYTWNLYRTSRQGVWANSLVVRGLTDPVYTDLGAATSAGQPPATTVNYSQPDKVILTDGGEVTGVLPPGLAIHPFEITLKVDGTLSAGTNLDVWTCEYPMAIIKGVRLSATGTPAAQDVIVDINKNHAGATPVWASVYSSQGHRPRLVEGFYVGVPTVPDDTSLVQGDSLWLDIDQAGGSATPTDRNLRVTVFGWAVFTTTVSTSPPWS